MSTINRPIKRGDVRTFNDSYNKGYRNIWASEVDAEFDKLYDTWNSALGGVLVTGTGVATQLAVWDSSMLLSGKTNLIWEDTNGRLTIPLRAGGYGTKGLRLTQGTDDVVLGISGTGAGAGFYITDELGNPMGLTVTPIRSPYGVCNLAVGGTSLTVNSGAFIVASPNTVQVSRDPTAALEVATKQYVDAKPAGGAAVSVTPPVAPIPGQLWWRNDPDGSLFVYYTDANSSQWVPAVPSTGIQALGGVTAIQALTQAAYDALGTKNATTLYVITT